MHILGAKREPEGLLPLGTGTGGGLGVQEGRGVGSS